MITALSLSNDTLRLFSTYNLIKKKKIEIRYTEIVVKTSALKQTNSSDLINH